MTPGLFSAEPEAEPGLQLLPGFALPFEAAILAALRQIETAAPFRNMETPGGRAMSAAMTSCGQWGWVSDRSGYRYSRADPLRDCPWPPMPEAFSELSAAAATAAGFRGFAPDSCLVNRYTPGARMGLHRDADELDFTQPIVSVSLGLPVDFRFGGAARSDRTRRLTLRHGDVVVWGGPYRLHYHGVLPLREGSHPTVGRMRVNLTFRKAR